MFPLGLKRTIGPRSVKAPAGPLDSPITASNSGGLPGADRKLLSSTLNVPFDCGMNVFTQPPPAVAELHSEPVTALSALVSSRVGSAKDCGFSAAPELQPTSASSNA